MGVLMLALLATTLASSHAQPASEPAPAPALDCAWAQLREASRLPGVDEWSVDLQLPGSMLASGSQAQLVERAARGLQARQRRAGGAAVGVNCLGGLLGTQRHVLYSVRLPPP